jgi:hypothetical protein
MGKYMACSERGEKPADECFKNNKYIKQKGDATS